MNNDYRGHQPDPPCKKCERRYEKIQKRAKAKREQTGSFLKDIALPLAVVDESRCTVIEAEREVHDGQ